MKKQKSLCRIVTCRACQGRSASGTEAKFKGPPAGSREMGLKQDDDRRGGSVYNSCIRVLLYYSTIHSCPTVSSFLHLHGQDEATMDHQINRWTLSHTLPCARFEFCLFAGLPSETRVSIARHDDPPLRSWRAGANCRGSDAFSAPCIFESRGGRRFTRSLIIGGTSELLKCCNTTVWTQLEVCYRIIHTFSDHKSEK